MEWAEVFFLSEIRIGKSKGFAVDGGFEDLVRDDELGFLEAGEATLEDLFGGGAKEGVIFGEDALDAQTSPIFGESGRGERLGKACAEKGVLFGGEIKPALRVGFFLLHDESEHEQGAMSQAGHLFEECVVGQGIKERKQRRQGDGGKDVLCGDVLDALAVIKDDRADFAMRDEDALDAGVGVDDPA